MSEQALAAIPSIGHQVARAIIAERNAKGAFTDAMNMAARLCTKTSIDFGVETSVKIQAQTYSPRGGSPKDPGWKCAVGTKEVELSGKKHNYVGHVTLLR